MGDIALAILPMIITVILYILIFSRKEELVRVKRSWRKYDWITFFSCIFGGVLFSSTMRASGLTFPAAPLLIAITLILVVFVAIALVRRAKTGRPVIQKMGDERTEMILAKSARNAFFVTYLVLFIRLCITDEGILDANWMLIVLSSSLLVLLVSLPVYTQNLK
jgi:hypothetical protein